jgi:hypothetical protein
VHVNLDFVRREILVTDQALVEVLLHKFEDEGKFTCVGERIPVG